jgi:hypothetical protein
MGKYMNICVASSSLSKIPEQWTCSTISQVSNLSSSSQFFDSPEAPREGTSKKLSDYTREEQFDRKHIDRMAKNVVSKTIDMKDMVRECYDHMKAEVLEGTREISRRGVKSLQLKEAIIRQLRQQVDILPAVESENEYSTSYAKELDSALVDSIVQYLYYIHSAGTRTVSAQHAHNIILTALCGDMNQRASNREIAVRMDAHRTSITKAMACMKRFIDAVQELNKQSSRALILQTTTETEDFIDNPERIHDSDDSDDSDFDGNDSESSSDGEDSDDDVESNSDDEDSEDDVDEMEAEEVGDGNNSKKRKRGEEEAIAEVGCKIKTLEDFSDIKVAYRAYRKQYNGKSNPII